jgi:hypothetical protein
MNELAEFQQQKIRSELKHGESILWTAQPNPIGYMKSSIIAVLFFIPWTAFSIFWIAGASGFKVPDFSKGGFAFFPLFGLPFLLIGIWGLSSPLREYSKAKNVIYVITTERVIIIEGSKSTVYKSFYPNQLKNIERIQKIDNSGNIYFQQESYTDSDGDKRSKKVGFIAINDVQTVENLIVKLANKKV